MKLLQELDFYFDINLISDLDFNFYYGRRCGKLDNEFSIICQDNSIKSFYKHNSTVIMTNHNQWFIFNKTHVKAGKLDSSRHADLRNGYLVRRINISDHLSLLRYKDIII